MDYKKHGTNIYARFDKGEEVVSKILEICKKENIKSATYTGIGGCCDVTVSTYILEEKEFLQHNKSGLLEMTSCIGNITCDDDGNLSSHTHAMFSYLEDGVVKVIGGHLAKAVILMTGEFVITPVQNALIKRKYDPQTGIMVWNL